MLIDHALSVMGSCGNLRYSKRKILWFLTFLIVALLLFSLSCLNLKLFRDRIVIGSQLHVSPVKESNESHVQELPEPVIEQKGISAFSGETLEIMYEPDTMPVQARAEISSTLYSAAIEAGMPVDVLIQMIRAYSYDVDFQRDIQRGDKFEAIYEKKVDKNGNYVRGGAILFSSLTVSGRTLTIYRYKTADGEVDLFNEKGQSVNKILMITPIDRARLSSGYGMRRHPIKGYSRMHKGLDFAAPTGIPIMAAGDGVIEYAGRKSGYGSYIRIRHANEYQTVYGHMSKFVSGIRKGVRIRQRQIIGYVGSTGLSTGPHLHYEVHHRGKNINPASLKTPPGRTLKGKELERFFQVKRDLQILYASLEKGDKLARLD
ncbi:MAG: M23 family metallopeptidase [Desulfobacteraceae bacterium]|jgi:murein DD-endopeptidase MepM/ murein hydrolase activator NlpD